MKEDVNVRIIKKLRESKCDKTLTDFIIELVREEFEHKDQARWNFSEVYDNKIKKFSKEYKVK